MIKQDKKLTGRSKRMQHFRELHSRAGLNIVSLMDIFTILVFFLLVNTSAQQLPSSKDVKLPTTVASKVPQETLVIAITRDSLLVGGRKVAALEQIAAGKGETIQPLLEELRFQAGKTVLMQDAESIRRSVMIMGDESMPYDLLSKILATCRHANYTNIAFAAIQQGKGKV